MIDRDLAEMYQVETKVLNQAVKRNIERFPDDFMFQLTDEEFQLWKSQIVTSNSIKMGLRRKPYAFTELGVAMLSSVLNSKTAIQINMGIMRAFVVVRSLISNTAPRSIEERVRMLEEANEDLLKEINDLSEDNRKEFDDIYLALAELANRNKTLNKPRVPVGFVKPDEK